MKIDRSNTPVLFFSKKEKEQIVNAIKDAEMQTSAEIRVHLERKAGEDILEHAQQIFQRLGMTKTADKNGVLIFLGVQSKRFCVIGDTGINAKVPEGFWNDVVQDMVGHFKEDRFAEGITQGIRLSGAKLKEYFPYQRDDVNELPDEISFSY